jgi:hypothetical protein
MSVTIDATVDTSAVAKKKDPAITRPCRRGR